MADLRHEITIGDHRYPCGLTMGAMIYFHDITGHELTQFDGSVRDMCAMLYSYTKGYCNREKRPFDVAFDEFIDLVEPDEVTRLANLLRNAEEPAPAKGSKKKK